MNRQTILEAASDPRLFQPWFCDKWLKKKGTWENWFAFLAAVFGLPMSDGQLLTFQECTGLAEPPPGGVQEAWLVVGRRGGKSLILALIAAYLATLVEWTPYLTKGERGVIMIAAADREQAQVLFRYIKEFISDVKALRPLIMRETQDSLDLSNGVSIQVATASYKSIRGRTVIAFLADEMAFWSIDGANPDREVLAAIRPSMATIPNSMLLVASSPYARRGELWDAFHRYYGKPSDALIWKASTKTMNPAISDRVIEKAYERDPASAAAEYGAEFRTDIESFIDRGLVESLAVPGRIELAPVPGTSYLAFVDPAGGSGSDSMTLAIAHKDPQSDRVVVDAIREVMPPFSPQDVVAEFVAVLNSYGVESVTGDHWGGLFVRQPFEPIRYALSDLNKSAIYRESLALLNSKRAELPDHRKGIAQICGLERRTARGGRDSIDHAPGAHDDIANAVMGALLLADSADRNALSWFAAGDGQTYSGDNIPLIIYDAPPREIENNNRSLGA